MRYFFLIILIFCNVQISNEAIKLSEDIKFALENLNIDNLTSLQNQIKT